MEFIESRLKDNTKKFLVDELENYILKDRKDKIILFDRFLCISKGEEFEDLNDKISDELNNWADGQISPKDLLMSLSVTEQYLKSLINLVDKSAFDGIMNKDESFKNIIAFIGMIKLRRNGKLDLKLTSNDERLNITTLEDKHKDDKTRLHWARAYSFRNEDAHECRKYGYNKSINYILSILFVLVESTWKYKQEIDSLYSEQLIFYGVDKKEYLRKIIKEYESKNSQKTFVLMNTSKVDPMSTWLSFEIDEEENDNSLSSSLDIMNMSKEYGNYLKLIGEAGIGKSRIMRHLQYNDAKEGKIFPVYVELKELSDFKYSIMELIYEKSGLDEKACRLLMENGGMNLYLDGVNEILCSDKNKRIACSQIDELPVKYPKTKILVSDRESSQVSVRMDIPTFLLSKLDESMIHEFVHKNCKSKDYEDKIINILEERNYIYNIIKTPFMLETFIYLVENNNYKKGVTNEEQLIELFIRSLIDREAYMKKEIRAGKIEMLLTYLFVEHNNLEDGRTSFTKPGVLSRFRKCKEHYGFEIDTDEILEIIVQMGLLERIQGSENYRFANEFYENYFFSKALLWIEE